MECVLFSAHTYQEGEGGEEVWFERSFSWIMMQYYTSIGNIMKAIL